MNLPSQWDSYSELSEWHDEHKACPVCGEDSDGIHMMCPEHQPLWEQEQKISLADPPGNYLALVNRLMAEPVLAKSPWIAEV